MTRYVIVGTGVAGVAAIEALRRADSTAEINAVTEDPHGFYSRPGLAYYLSDEIPRNRLSLFSRHDWKALHVHYIQDRVTRLDPVRHKIELAKAGSLSYDRLLLATGSTAVPIDVPGGRSKGVVKLDTVEDARHMLSLARHARTAIIVGGGIIAVEMAEGLACRGVKVHYFLRGGRYWSNVLDEAESHLIEDHLTQRGISLHYHTEIAEILSRGGKVSGVRTKQGETLPCGMVAVGIGVKARSELAQAAGLKTERGILVDDHLRTSDPDIHAAGDAAQVVDRRTGASTLETLWLPARIQGWTAATNMSGKNQVYRRATATNVLRLAGVMISIIGAVGGGRDDDLVSVARGSSETWLQLPNTIAAVSNSELNHLRLMVGESTLTGALVLGEQKLSRPLQELISQQADIMPIRSQLLQPEAQLGHIIMDYWSSTSVRRSGGIAAQK